MKKDYSMDTIKSDYEAFKKESENKLERLEAESRIELLRLEIVTKNKIEILKIENEYTKIRNIAGMCNAKCY